MNLHGRSLLKEIDLTEGSSSTWSTWPSSCARRSAAGTEDHRLAGRNIALIFEKTSTRTRSAFEVAAHDQGAHVTYLGPGGLPARPQGVDEGHRPGARAGCSTASSTAGSPRRPSRPSPRYAGVPVWNGLTDQWHPTQMLADILTMRDHAAKPLTEVCVLLPRRRPEQHGQLAAGHRRPARAWTSGSCAPAALSRPSPTCRTSPRSSPPGSGARADGHRRPRHGASRARTSSTPTSGCRWASRPTDWDERIDQLLPYQVNADVLAATGNPEVQVHALPAGAAQPRHRDRAADLRQARPRRRSRSPTRSSSRRPRSSSTRPRTGCTPSRPLMVATIGSAEHADRRRPGRQCPARARARRPTPTSRRTTSARPSRHSAPLAREHDLVITHGNGPQVGLLALESAGDPALAHPYPLDVLGRPDPGHDRLLAAPGASERLPGRQVACLVSQTLVSADDPAFANPTKFVGPVYDEAAGPAARGRPRLAGPQGRRRLAAGRALT